MYIFQTDWESCWHITQRTVMRIVFVFVLQTGWHYSRLINDPRMNVGRASSSFFSLYEQMVNQNGFLG